jgi:hypothetical protein
MSHSDSGHLGNLKSFDELLSAVKGFPAGYNPSKNEFQIQALEAKSVKGHKQMENLNVIISAYKSALEHRTVIFASFQNLITSIFNFVNWKQFPNISPMSPISPWPAFVIIITP